MPSSEIILGNDLTPSVFHNRVNKHNQSDSFKEAEKQNRSF